MKRRVVVGLALIAVAALVLGNAKIGKYAEISPPEPFGIISIK